MTLCYITFGFSPAAPKTQASAFSKHLLGSFEFSIHSQSDLCRSWDAGARLPSFRSSRGLSLSGFQVNYFLFFWVCSLSPFPGHPLPSPPHTHSWPPSRQLCSKPIIVSRLPWSTLQQEPWGLFQSAAISEQKYVITVESKGRVPCLLITFCPIYWTFVLLAPAC